MAVLKVPLSIASVGSLTYSGNGKAELYTTSAGAKDTVYFLADPEPGYAMDYSKSRYHHEEHDLSWAYIGNNMYAITMPDGDVMLDLEFVKIPTDSHDVKLTVSEGGTHNCKCIVKLECNECCFTLSTKS